MPVLGVIFLRHAANRFEAAQRQIEVDQGSGKMPKRKLRPKGLHQAARALPAGEGQKAHDNRQDEKLRKARDLLLPKLMNESIAV